MRKHRCSSNTEALASELIETLEEMFHLCHTDSDLINRFKSSTTHKYLSNKD